MTFLADYITDCFDIPEGELWELERDLPGYRFETVYPDGRIGYYPRDKTTDIATCLNHPESTRFPFQPRPPAFHEMPCTCGHRIVRSKKELADFAVHVAASPAAGSMSVYLNHAFGEIHGGTTGLALVKCFAPAGSLITHRNLDDEELPGTIRTDQLRLGKSVYMPRWLGDMDQLPFAARVRDYYGDVRVTVSAQDGLEFTNALNEDMGASGESRHPCGDWGFYGAAGVLFTSSAYEETRYLITRRSDQLTTHAGLWGVPGGARDEFETTLQAATRKVEEELGVMSLACASIIGATEYERPGGWAYATYLAHVPEPFDVLLDGIELTDHRWVTPDELTALTTTGALISPFAEKVPELLELRQTWEQFLKHPRGLTNQGWVR